MTATDCCGASRAAKVARESRERTANGCTSFVRVAEVGWTHRASSASGGRKASWSERALAGRKPEALPDAGHGWREGETVRGQALVLNSSTLDRPAGASLQVLNTTEGVLGLLCIRPLRVRVFQSPSACRSTSASSPSRKRTMRRPAHRAVSETDSGVPAGDHESVRDRRHSVKAPRGPRRSEGSSHPRR